MLLSLTERNEVLQAGSLLGSHATDRVVVRYVHTNVTKGRKGLRGFEVVPLEDGEEVQDAIDRLLARDGGRPFSVPPLQLIALVYLH